VAKIINNSVELQTTLGVDLQRALDLTMKELLDKLQDFIVADVYSAWSPSFYERTTDTINNWEYSNPTINGTEASSTLEMTNLSHNMDKFQHGSYISGDLSVDYFLDILNGKRPIGNAFNFPQVKREPFWDDYLQWVESNIDNIWQKNCKLVMG
jgi:hypothetical protein